MEKTFKNFARDYTKELSGENTLSFRKLLPKCDDRDLRSAVVLYAITSGKADGLRKMIRKSEDPESFRDMMDALEALNLSFLLESIEDDKSGLGPGYRKCLEAYGAHLEKQRSEYLEKHAIAEEVMEMLRDTNTSIRFLSKLTDVDYSNLHKWLNHSETSHICLSRAKAILNTTRNYVRCLKDIGGPNEEAV